MRRQNSNHFNNLWSNPGGKVESDESLEEAVIRELSEELGIKVRILRKISDYFDYQNESLFGIYSGYEVEIMEGIPEIREPHKIVELNYFPMDDLPQNTTPYTLQYIRDLKR